MAVFSARKQNNIKFLPCSSLFLRQPGFEVQTISKWRAFDTRHRPATFAQADEIQHLSSAVKESGYYEF